MQVTHFNLAFALLKNEKKLIYSIKLEIKNFNITDC